MSPLVKGIVVGVISVFGAIFLTVVARFFIALNMTGQAEQIVVIVVFVVATISLLGLTGIGLYNYKTYLSDFGLGLAISIPSTIVLMICIYIYSSYMAMYTM